MPDVPEQAKSMLSSWVKHPNLPMDPLQTSVKPDKAAAKQQWSAIFNKPAKAEALDLQNIPTDTFESHNSSDTLESDASTQPDAQVGSIPPYQAQTIDNSMQKPAKKRHINPHSPFSSFVVTMKTPKGTIFPVPDPNDKSMTTDSNTKLESPQSGTQDSMALSSQNSQTSQNSQIEQKKNAFTSFFAKRPTGPKLVKEMMPLRPFKPIHAPYKVDHIRPECTWQQLSVAKRDRSSQSSQNTEVDINIEDLVNQSVQAALQSKLFLQPLPSSRKPARRLMTSLQLREVALRSQSRHSRPQTSLLCDTAGDLHSFDLGIFESKMWSEKYAPKDTAHHFLPQAAESVASWLKAQQRRLEKSPNPIKPRRPKHKTALDDFVVDDRDVNDSGDEDESAILVISGPSGSGKTPAVYAAAQELDLFVFEVNCGVKRTGKELTAMLEGISRNHIVHSAKNVVILVDDADIVYENEAGTFWPTITRFASISHRPVVITCTDPSLVSLAPAVPHDYVHMTRPSLILATDLAWTIALNEGHLLDKQRLASLVVQCRGDLRQVLATLQFWCQFGIGGSASGSDWVPKLSEFRLKQATSIKNGTNNTNIITSDSETEDEREMSCENNEAWERPRVISDNTWFQLPSEQSKENEPLVAADLLGPEFGDIRDTSLDEIETRSEDSIWTNTALPITHWKLPIEPPAQVAHTRAIKNAIDPYSFYCYSTRNQLLMTEIAPYIRLMVVSDAQRQLAKNASLANLSDREQRMTLRSMKDAGIDTRNYLNLSLPMMTSVINTGFKKASEPVGNTGPQN